MQIEKEQLVGQVYHKRGDTLSLSCQWLDSDNNPIDLTGYTITSQVRAVGFVDDLTITVTSAVDGQFVLSATATDTSSWPVTSSQASRTFCDIQFQVGPNVVSSETFQVIVIEDITQ
jgi:hypothetical protein